MIKAKCKKCKEMGCICIKSTHIDMGKSKEDNVFKDAVWSVDDRIDAKEISKLLEKYRAKKEYLVTEQNIENLQKLLYESSGYSFDRILTEWKNSLEETRSIFSQIND